MRHVLLAALLPLLTLSQTALADGFEDLLTRLNIMPQSGRQAVVDSLMANLPGGETPIREADRAWFLYLGSATSLSLAGDMTGWSPDLDFIPLAGTTLWTLRFLCEEDARLDYKFVRNGSSWILDPLNPHTCSGGFGPNSELAMPAYVQPEEIQNQGLPNGTLVTWTAFHSPQLNNTRTIQVLLPPGHVEGQPRGICVVHDGSEYLSLGSLRMVVAWLADRHPELELPIFVCVPPVNRTAEYQTTQQEAFGHFIVDTVLPQVRATWTTYSDPARCITLGASNGGNISAYLLGQYPQVFGRGVLMSPYLPAEQQARLAALDADSLRLYLNWGSYDLDAIIPGAQATAQMLEAGGVPHLDRLYHEGHSWGLWRATLDEGLLFVLDPAVGVAPQDRGHAPRNLELKAWPNPFNGRVQVELPPGTGEARVRCYDALGRLRDELATRSSSLVWDTGSLPSGTYVLEARRASQRGVTALTLLR
jgi:enterochelin esterase family protein